MFNNVKAPVIWPLKVNDSRTSRGGVISPRRCETLPADAVSCLSSASPSDELHAGQINGFHPTLRTVGNDSAWGKKS